MSQLPSISFRQRASIAWRILAGSYAGASKSRRSLSRWTSSAGSADSDLEGDLDALRERSRDLIRNNPLAAGAVAVKVTNVVGTGLKLSAQIDREALGLSDDQADEWEMIAEREFNAWASTPDCDITRTSNFAELQWLAFRSVLENGDAFALLPSGSSASDDYTTRVQLLEADRVSNPNRRRDTSELSAGVQRDANGAPSSYWITSAHPGSTGASTVTWSEFQAFGANSGRRNVLHLYNRLRIGQSRGIPDLAPVVEALKSLGEYSKAELDAAVVTSYLTIITKTDNRAGLGLGAYGVDGDSSDDRTEPYTLGPATVLDLKGGEDVSTIDPNRPNRNFDPFTLSMLRQIGMALELPFEVLVKHFTASYSAARAAMEDAKRFFKGRRAWLAAHFCQPIYETIIDEAVAMGKLQAPGYFDSPAIRRAYLGDARLQWVGDAWTSIDPVKQVKSDELAVNMGWKTNSEVTAEMTGGDWEKKQRRRRREQSLMPEGEE